MQTGRCIIFIATLVVEATESNELDEDHIRTLPERRVGDTTKSDARDHGSVLSNSGNESYSTIRNASLFVFTTAPTTSSADAWNFTTEHGVSITRLSRSLCANGRGIEKSGLRSETSRRQYGTGRRPEEVVSFQRVAAKYRELAYLFPEFMREL